MDTKKAVKILRKTGHKVERVNEKWRVKYPLWSCPKDGLSDRELISLARIFSSDNTEAPNMRVKKYGHRINRRRTKDLLDKEKWDQIPPEKPVYKEDVWNWD